MKYRGLISTTGTRKYFWYLSYFYCLFNYVKILMLSKDENPTFNVILSWQQDDYYIQVWPSMISDCYVRILVPYYRFMYYGVFISHRLQFFLNLGEHGFYLKLTTCKMDHNCVIISVDFKIWWTKVCNLIIGNTQCKLLLKDLGLIYTTLTIKYWRNLWWNVFPHTSIELLMLLEEELPTFIVSSS